MNLSTLKPSIFYVYCHIFETLLFIPLEMHLLKLFILLFFSTSAIIVSAQDTIITNVIVFDKSDLNETTEKKKDKISLFKNAIKINPLLLLRGELPIYYERVIHKNFSIEASIGVTFKDYISMVFEQTSFNDELFLEDVTETIKPNISYSFGVRYFPSGYALDGVYFAVYYAKRDFDLGVAFNVNTPYFDPTSFIMANDFEKYEFTEQRHHNEIRIIYGENEFYYWDNMFLDFYVGVGVDYYSEKKVKTESPINPMIPKKTYYLDSKESIIPKFYLGVKYGFVF